MADPRLIIRRSSLVLNFHRWARRWVRVVVPVLVLALCVPRWAEAQTTFTWTTLSAGNASGSWNTASNWNSGAGPVANGADNTADFSALDITADSTVTLDGNQTIGHLVFGDTNTVTSANWTISTPGADSLTLDVSGGSPTVTVNAVNATVNATIAGSEGLTKEGTGTLILSSFNTFSGGTTINAGVVQIVASSTTPFGTGAVANNASIVSDLSIFDSITIQVSNAISGSGTLTQTGDGATWLTGANSYSGTTTISGGALMANDGVGLPTGSFLNLDGGVLMGDGTTSFTRSLGASGGGKLQWNTGGGGFAASGGDLTVNIGGAGGEVVWGTAVGSGIVGPLRFGHNETDAAVRFVNGIDLNNTATPATRTISVTAGASNEHLLAAEISGVIRNSNAAGGLTIDSPADSPFEGTIFLSAANTYTGITTVGTGSIAIPVLRANDGVGLPTASFLSLNGGVLEGQGTATFTRSLGTSGSGKFQWTSAGGGFAAHGGQLTVNIGGVGGELVWGTSVGSQIVGQLRFGASDADAKTLFVNGIDLNNTATAATRTIIVTGGVGGDVAEVSGVVRNSNAAGGLNVSGGGTLMLSAMNTYTGTTSVFGVLRAVDGVGLPTASFLNLNGGVFEGNGTTSFTRSLGTSGSGKFQWSGAPFGGGGFAAHGGQLTVDIGGAGGEVVWGTVVGSQIVGTLEFGSPTANAKTLFVNGIDLNNTATPATRGIQVNVGTGGDSAEISGVIRNSNASGGLTLGTFSGTLILSGANTYSGTTTISSFAELQIGSGGTSGTLGTGPVVINSTGLLIFNRSDSLTVGNAISGGNGALTQAGSGTTILTGSNSYSGTTTISAGALQIGDGGTLGTLGTGGVINNASLVFNRSDSLTVGAGISGSGSVTQAGSGTTILTNSLNSYSGGTIISSGVLQVGNGVSNGTLGTGSVTNNASLVFNRSSSLTVSAAISGSGSLTQAGTGTITLTGANSYDATLISAGTLQIGNNGTTGTLGTGNVTNNANLTFSRSDTITVANAISGIGSVTKSGAGTTILTGTNSYGGTTTISGGQLHIGNGGTTGALGGGAVTISGSSTRLVFNRSDTITAGNNISSTGGLIQDGAGTTVLTGTNNYSGTTTINAGVLQIGNGGTAGALGTGSVTNNSSLVFNRSDSITVANDIDGTGSVTQAGSGTTIVTNSSSSYSGGTIINSGVLQVGNGVSNGTLGTGAVTNNASLVFNRLSALSVGVVISGTGSVTQAGPGALTFTNANTYMGDTLVNAGTLTLSGSGSFANSPTISLATGTLLSVGSVSSGANHNGSRFALASGQTLKGTGTVSGNMAVRNGATLAPGGSIGTLNTGSVTIDSGGTLALELDIGGTPDADLLNVTGTSVVITGATLNLTLSNVTPGPDKTFLVLANDFSDAITGTFASITGLPVGYLATLDYAYSGTDVLGRVGTGNDLAVTIITFIPETRAWVMVGAVGAVALGVARWRARQRGAAG